MLQLNCELEHSIAMLQLKSELEHSFALLQLKGELEHSFAMLQLKGELNVTPVSVEGEPASTLVPESDLQNAKQLFELRTQLRNLEPSKRLNDAMTEHTSTPLSSALESVEKLYMRMDGAVATRCQAVAD